MSSNSANRRSLSSLPARKRSSKPGADRSMPELLSTSSFASKARIASGRLCCSCAAIGVERKFAPRSGVALPDEPRGLARLGEAEVFEAVERQVREGAVDHQMVDIPVRDAAFLEGL